MTCTRSWDMIILKPGTPGRQDCRVCGCVMQVTRDVLGPTSWAASMGKAATPHDLWKCIDHDKDWHTQAKKLLQLAANTPSPSMAKLYNEDAAEILLKCEKTKDWFNPNP